MKISASMAQPPWLAPVALTSALRFRFNWCGLQIRKLEFRNHDPPPRARHLAAFQSRCGQHRGFGLETCGEYLGQARALVSQARALAEKVHGASKLTSPTSDM